MMKYFLLKYSALNKAKSYAELFILFLMSGLIYAPSSTHAAEVRKVNLVAFEMEHDNAHFEGLFTGSLGELVVSLEKNAHVILATRTPAVQDRDIINIQTDVLRMTQENKLANSGLNCHFIFDDESDEDSLFYSISGACDQLTSDTTGTQKKKFMVKRTMLSDPSEIFNVWTKFYEDKQTGLVFYVDID